MSLVMPHPRKPRGLLIGPDLTVSGSHPFFIEHPSIRRSSLFQVFEFVRFWCVQDTFTRDILLVASGI